MNTSKKNIGLNNGWILCPSKTFAGKFYYFNVLNGETAWSLNDADNKCPRKDTTIADKSHDYPEPTSLPDESTIGPQVVKVNPNIIKPNFVKTIPCTENQPTFGKASFPNYVANTDKMLMPNIIWTPVQLPMPMFCPETRQPMFDKVTQTSEFEQRLFIETCDIPLYKRFKNYENPSLSFENNKIVNKSVYNFDISTPKSSYINNRTQPQIHIPDSNVLYKQPVSKLECQLPNTKTADMINNNAKSTLIHGNTVKNTKMDEQVTKTTQEEEGLCNLDRNDLRFLLLAKRRKSVDTKVDAVVEKKKPKPPELVTPKKKVTFNLDNVSDQETVLSDNEQEEFNPSPDHTAASYEISSSPILGSKGTSTPTIKNNNHSKAPRDVPTICRQKDTVVSMGPKKATWYIVVDTDVILLDKEFVEELVLSDIKCKLLIPHAVRADIASLCFGDCCGQQRVINARQITRRLATPPPHYIVEPEPAHEDDIVVTTDSILQCCINAVNDNHYVVLITNDPYLQGKASSLHIPNYKLNEIKNGVKIKQDMTSELAKINISISNGDSIKNTNSIQNKNGLSLFSDESRANTVKKQLFLNNDKDIELNKLDCDKLINITKPNSLKNIDSVSKCDTTNKKNINFNLRERNILRFQNGNENQFADDTVYTNEDGYTNFEKIIQTSNSVPTQIDFEKNIPNSKLDVKKNISLSNHEIHHFEKGSLLKNSERNENMFYPNHISNIKKFLQNSEVGTTGNQSNTKITESIEISFDTNMPKMTSKNEPFEPNRKAQILNPRQLRLKKIFNNINFDSKNQEHIPKTNDPTGIFKVPQPLQFKNRTKNSSVHDGSSTPKGKILRREFNTDSFDETLKRFCVKSMTMSQKLSSRMDEWICSYTQIMEDVLNKLLQSNSECMKNIVHPLTLHDTLNCIKMLYGSNKKVRDAIENLSDLINICMCKKDKSKPSLNPDQYMKFLGYGILLILSLEEIVPQCEDLLDSESRLCSLLSNIESTSIELDPELVKTPYANCTDVADTYEERRPNFSKEPSYIISYLKKHYKAWALIDEDTLKDKDFSKSQNHTNVKIVRTSGKNISLLKLDNSKTMSLSKKSIDVDSTKNIGDKPEIISFVEVNQVNKPAKDTNGNVGTVEMKENVSRVSKPAYKPPNTFLNITDNRNDDIIKSKYFTTQNNQETDVSKVMKRINKTDQSHIQKVVEEIDLSEPGHAFMQNAEISGPKMIRNMKLIDEYEKRIQNREPLDLDLLDYSEIYEPSEMANFHSYNSNNSESIAINDDENNKLNNTKDTVKEFTEDLNLGNRIKFDRSPILGSKNFSFTIKKKVTDTKTNTNPKTEPKNDNYYFYPISKNDSDINHNIKNTETRTKNNDNMPTNNDSCIDNDNSEIHTDVSEIHNDNSEIHNNVSDIRDDNDNFDKLAQVRDDTTNDSGFENDSTCAHSVVKIFLHELSTSFKVIYEFVNNFIIDIHDIESCELRKNILHDQARKALGDMVAIVDRLKSIIKRETAEDTLLKSLLLKAGLEATTDKRIMRYRQIVTKSLEQAKILENALKVITSTTTRGNSDVDDVSITVPSVSTSIKYINIFE